MKVFKDLEVGNKLWEIRPGGDIIEHFIEKIDKSTNNRIIFGLRGHSYVIAINAQESEKFFIKLRQAYVGTDLDYSYDRFRQILLENYENLISDTTKIFFERIKKLDKGYENFQGT